jgi:class 3 adenylate cyclase
MSDQQEIEQAIGALEAQRSILGDAATDAALDGLRQRLAELTGESKQGSIPAPETQGERRIVTVLFCDVTGSTALAESMDPEAWTEIMNAIFEHLIEPVERFGGTIARLMGDAILAFFGAPIAHEDDPQRAVLAGVAIIEEIQPFREQLQREKGLSFDVRVGINTGLVVVGEVGSQTAGEYTAMGDAVNLAARMEQTAAPGTVQVSEETYRYVAPLFEWQELGHVAVKGKAEPVQTFQPLARKKQPGPVRGLATHGISSPLIGRERELRALREAGAHLPEGHGALVSIVGAAGLGKSRLVAEFRREGLTGESNAPNWLEAHALSHAGSSVYFSWQQIIRHSLDADESDAPATVRTRLEAICTRIGLPAEHVPYLALLLAVEDEGSSRHANVQEGEALAQHIRQAAGEYLQRLSQESPLVLVFDDLHWADSASVALLDNLAPLALAHPILILALYRPDLDAESWHFREAAAEKLGRSHVEIQLHPLPKDSSLAMLENLLLAQTLPESFLELIFQRSGGNPLFIEEVIRTLLDKGVLTEEESGWVLVQEVDDIEIPGNLQAMLVARIDRLEEVTRRTLQIASVIGTSFYFRVLSQLAGAITHLEQKVSSLERADLVRLEAQLPELEYAFRHVLIQEAAYATLRHAPTPGASFPPPPSSRGSRATICRFARRSRAAFGHPL